MKNFVNVVKKPFEIKDMYSSYPEEIKNIMLKASLCQYCEKPACINGIKLDVRGIMRRVCVGNFVGALRLLENLPKDKAQQEEFLNAIEYKCSQKDSKAVPVEIKLIIDYLNNWFC
jgi:prolycopene isomerase